MSEYKISSDKNKAASGALSRLEQDLTDPTKRFPINVHTELARTQSPEVPHTWKKPELPKQDPVIRKKRIFDKIFYASIFFFVLTGLIAVLAWAFDWSAVSSEKIEFSVEGNTELRSGEVSVFTVKLHNKNDTGLEQAKLVVTYPPGTRSSDGEDLIQQEIKIETLAPDESYTEAFRFIAYGEKGDREDIKIRFEYRVPDSSAPFALEKEFNALIDSSPFIFSVDFPEDVSSRQTFSFDISISSNSQTTFEGLMLKALTPSEFTFVSSSVEPRGTSGLIWDVGDLKPREERTITISGILEGEPGESRQFSFELGIPDENNSNELTAVLGMEQVGVVLGTPPVSLDIRLPDSRVKNNVIEGGGALPVAIVWKNNTQNIVTDASIALTLSGGFDPSRIETEGRYSSGDQTVRWTSAEEQSLASLASKDSGSVNVRIPINRSNPQGLTLTAVLSGSIGGSPVRTISTTRIPLSFGEKVVFSAEALRASRSFAVEGPYPPQVGVESTYVLRLAVTNPSSNLENARVQASLPSSVEWRNEFSASVGDVTFDSSRRLVTWNLGNVSPVIGDPLLDLHIGFTPDVQDRGRVPLLLTDIVFSARNTSTEENILFTAIDLTTDIAGDREDGMVPR